MNDASPVDYQREIPEILRAMSRVHTAMDTQGFDRTLYHLVQLRSSQINRCAHCVSMHTKEAREDGESNDRLDRIVVWQHVDDFSEREKAALAWTEALTALGGNTDYAGLRARLRVHFTEKEIGVLTAIVAMINLWNRIQVSRH